MVEKELSRERFTEGDSDLIWINTGSKRRL